MNDILVKLVSELDVATRNTQVPDVVDRSLMCILMLMCNGYDFNEGVIIIYNNAHIRSLWGCVERALSYCTMKGLFADDVHGVLLANRSAYGFGRMMMMGKSRSLVRTTVTSSSLIHCRDVMLSRVSNEIMIPNPMEHVVSVSGNRMHRNYLDMMTSKTGCMGRIPIFDNQHHSACQCDPLSCMACYDIQMGTTVDVCPTHGHKGPGFLLWTNSNMTYIPIEWRSMYVSLPICGQRHSVA
jgi:hypothetical protein